LVSPQLHLLLLLSLLLTNGLASAALGRLQLDDLLMLMQEMLLLMSLQDHGQL
jgi:hypothetical protein